MQMSVFATNRVARRLKGSGGFTLIELVAVIIIIAIMAAAAVPSLSNLTDTRAGMASKQLLRDLTFARQRAVATGAPTWVVFDTNANTWTILVEDLSNPGRANATALPDAATGRSFVQSLDAGSLSGVRFVSVDFDSNLEVGFNWLGKPLNSTETQLTAEGSVILTGGHSINIVPETGHIYYSEP